jgi:hypothetical protein
MRGGHEVRRRSPGDDSRRGRGDSQRSILERIEEKLARLLGSDDDPDARRDSGSADENFAPEALTWDEGDVEPRILGGPHASAPGWDPSFAGPRFDRVDLGSVGTHAAHPVSSVEGAYGVGPSGYRSSAREHYIAAQAARHAPGGGGGGGGEHHRHYADWRNQQIETLDRAFEEYCREKNESFAQEFGDWRAKRQNQRDSLAKVSENMDVVGSDGEPIGRVEAVVSGAIAVARDGADGRKAAGLLPYSWIQAVGVEVVIDRPAAEAEAKLRPAEARSEPQPAPASG